MLGAEGIKNVVHDRLHATMPTAIAAVSHKFGAHPGEIPLPTDYYMSAVPFDEVPTGAYPFVTIRVDDTDGELSSEIVVSHERVEVYKLGYNVAIAVYTQVSAQDGEPVARLQAERLVLAIRECLLWDRDLNPPGDDTAVVNFGRWGEEYDTELDSTTGAWMGGAGLIVPITTFETLDRAPYIDREAYLVGYEVSGQDPVTGEPLPGGAVGETYPRPDGV